MITGLNSDLPGRITARSTSKTIFPSMKIRLCPALAVHGASGYQRGSGVCSSGLGTAIVGSARGGCSGRRCGHVRGLGEELASRAHLRRAAAQAGWAVAALEGFEFRRDRDGWTPGWLVELA